MNPLFIVLIILAVVAAVILAILNTPQGRGFLGERYIRFILGKTKEGKRYVLNNYMVEEGGKSSQIDHILINPNGVFVIETKNYSGRIYGKDNQQEWTQSLNYGKVTNKFYNPVKQNATHVYRISKILPNDAPIFSVVVFTKDNVQFIESEHVVGSSRLGRTVKQPRHRILSSVEMYAYYDVLLKNRSSITAKEHIAEIKTMKANVEANICPRCGGKLVERNGKYGKFWGCENYPDCKFIKK